MKSISADTLRVNIFSELVNLDSDKLNQIYNYVKSLTAKDDTDSRILKELLESSANYALQAHKRGEFYTTQEVMEELDKEMGWT